MNDKVQWRAVRIRKGQSQCIRIRSIKAY